MVTAMRFVVLVAALTLTSSCSWGADAAAKVACTDASVAADYSAIQSKRSACEATSGVVMALPLGSKLKKTLCEKCPELLALTQAKSLPKCTVTVSGEVINLQQEFNRLFKPCISGDSSGASDSAAGGSDDTASPAATVAPGGADTTTTATTETPKTKAPKTPKPSKTKKNGASATSSSDDDDDTTTTPKTKAPKTPKPSKSAKASAAGASTDDGSMAIESTAGSEEIESSSSAGSAGSLSKLPAMSSSGSHSEVSSKANATSGTLCFVPARTTVGLFELTKLGFDLFTDATIRTGLLFNIVVVAATLVLVRALLFLTSVTMLIK